MDFSETLLVTACFADTNAINRGESSDVKPHMKETPNFEPNLKGLGRNNATCRSVYVSTIKRNIFLLHSMYDQVAQ